MFNPLAGNRALKQPTSKLRSDLHDAIKSYQDLAKNTDSAGDKAYYQGIVSAYKKVLYYYLGDEYNETA